MIESQINSMRRILENWLEENGVTEESVANKEYELFDITNVIDIANVTENNLATYQLLRHGKIVSTLVIKGTVQ